MPTSKTNPPEAYGARVPVTVELPIGEVELGGGDENVLVAAMRLIAEAESRNPVGGVYHFQGSTIEITHPWGGHNQDPLRTFLSQFFPDVLHKFEQEKK